MRFCVALPFVYSRHVSLQRSLLIKKLSAYGDLLLISISSGPGLQRNCLSFKVLFKEPEMLQVDIMGSVRDFLLLHLKESVDLL